MTNFSLFNSGCGLGDMLQRISLIYRWCKKYNHTFHMPVIRSTTHNQNYDEVLNLTKIKPHLAEWCGTSEIIQIKDLDNYISNSDSNHLYLIKFDHQVARLLEERHFLRNIEDFSIPNPNCTTQKITNDVFIHLRLGDNYIYRINENEFFDSGRRMIVNTTKDLGKENSWTTPSLLRILEVLNNRNLSWIIHCDGVTSALSLLNTTKIDQLVKRREEITSAIIYFENQFLSHIDTIKNILYPSNNINSTILELSKSNYLIYSKGGFITGINKYFNKSKATEVSFAKAYDFFDGK